MANTAINIPGLPTGLTVSTILRNTATLADVETVSCTETADGYTGTVTGAHAGLFCFDILINGVVVGKQFRTIADDAGPYVISTDLEQLAQQDTSGNGPHVVTITIEDSSDDSALENVSVRLTEGADSFTVVSNANGEAAFALQGATYSVTATKTGYVSHIGSLAVSADASSTIQLTSSSAVSAPTASGFATGVMTMYSEEGAIEENVPVTLTFVSGPGVAGFGYDKKARTENSDSNGLVQFTGLVHGATYSIYRGSAPASGAKPFGNRSTGAAVQFTVPVANSFELPEISGKDAE